VLWIYGTEQRCEELDIKKTIGELSKSSNDTNLTDEDNESNTEDYLVLDCKRWLESDEEEGINLDDWDTNENNDSSDYSYFTSNMYQCMTTQSLQLVYH